LLDNTVGVVVQRGCAKWRAREIRNWLLILISPAGGFTSPVRPLPTPLRPSLQV